MFRFAASSTLTSFFSLAARRGVDGEPQDACVPNDRVFNCQSCLSAFSFPYDLH